MRNVNRFALLTAGLLALPAPAAWADGYACSAAEIRDADAQFKKALDLERAGNPRVARDTVAVPICMSDYAPYEPFRKRTALAIARHDEKNGRWNDAWGWYYTAGSMPDAGRMSRRLAEAHPQDTNIVGNAIQFLVEQGQAVNERAVRAMAAQNVERLLALEQQKFVGMTRVTTNQYLGEASGWAEYAQTGKDRIQARLLQRGDTLAVETSARELQGAINFYHQAEAEDRVAKIQVRARALADANLKKGDTITAATLYEVAGDNDKAESVAKAGATKTAQDEKARQKQFKKEQDDLEKELGF